MAPTRPVIGLNLDLVPAGKTQRAHLRLNQGYAESILAAGGLPVLMPVFEREADVAAFLDRLDGFVLTGGLDLDPRRLGQPPHSSVRAMPERREECDRMLVRQLFERRLPTIGIGVGLHLLNVACGGTLYQHLPEDCPRGLPHWDPSSHEPHRHIVQLQPGTRLEEIYGGGELRVNGNHHQAVRQVGAKFRPAALAPDGVIEAVESADPSWFCVGVQWQPEAGAASALDSQLFECLIQACGKPSLALAG